MNSNGFVVDNRMDTYCFQVAAMFRSAFARFIVRTLNLSALKILRTKLFLVFSALSLRSIFMSSRKKIVSRFDFSGAICTPKGFSDVVIGVESVSLEKTCVNY
jgi:hypothetical protein